MVRDRFRVWVRLIVNEGEGVGGVRVRVYTVVLTAWLRWNTVPVRLILMAASPGGLLQLMACPHG